jgi:hypothetical protein
MLRVVASIAPAVLDVSATQAVQHFADLLKPRPRCYISLIVADVFNGF